MKAWWINHTYLLEAEEEEKWRLANPEAAAAADLRAPMAEAERQALWDKDMAACKAGAKKRKPKPACKGCGSPTGANPAPMSPAVATQASPQATDEGWTTVTRRRP
jgi:hypothetical protein